MKILEKTQFVHVSTPDDSLDLLVRKQPNTWFIDQTGKTESGYTWAGFEERWVHPGFPHLNCIVETKIVYRYSVADEWGLPSDCLFGVKANAYLPRSKQYGHGYWYPSFDIALAAATSWVDAMRHVMHNSLEDWNIFYRVEHLINTLTELENDFGLTNDVEALRSCIQVAQMVDADAVRYYALLDGSPEILRVCKQVVSRLESIEKETGLNFNSLLGDINRVLQQFDAKPPQWSITDSVWKGNCK